MIKPDFVNKFKSPQEKHQEPEVETLPLKSNVILLIESDKAELVIALSNCKKGYPLVN